MQNWRSIGRATLLLAALALFLGVAAVQPAATQSNVIVEGGTIPIGNLGIGSSRQDVVGYFGYESCSLVSYDQCTYPHAGGGFITFYYTGDTVVRILPYVSGWVTTHGAQMGMPADEVHALYPGSEYVVWANTHTVNVDDLGYTYEEEIFCYFGCSSSYKHEIFVAGAPTPVTVTITPTTSLDVPACGGSFSYDVAITNHTASLPFAVDAWADYMHVSIGSARGIARQPIDLTLQPGATISASITQRVPAGAAAGTYLYGVRLGNFSRAHVGATILVNKLDGACQSPADAVDTWN